MREDDRVTSIIDTIDQAIADHELSSDAMRWTPEPPRLVGPRITPEQAAAIRARIAQEIRLAVEAFRAMAAALVKTVRNMQPMIEAYQRAQKPPPRLSRRRKRMAIRRERYDQRVRRLTSR